MTSLVSTNQKKCWLALTLLAGAFVAFNTFFLSRVAGRESLIPDLIAVCLGLTAQMVAFGRRFYPTPLQRDAASAQQAHALLDGIWSRAKDDLALLEGSFSKDRIAWHGAFAAGIMVLGVILQFALARRGAPVVSISVATAGLLLAFCLVPWMLYAPLVMSWSTVVISMVWFSGSFTPMTLTACLIVGIESCLFAMISDRLVTDTCFADLKTKASRATLQWLRPVVQLVLLSCVTFAVLPGPERQKKTPFTPLLKQKAVVPTAAPRNRNDGVSVSVAKTDGGTRAVPSGGASTGSGGTTGAGTKTGGNPGTEGGTGTTAGSGSGTKKGTGGGSGGQGGTGSGPGPKGGTGRGTGAPVETAEADKAPTASQAGEEAETKPSPNPSQVSEITATKKLPALAHRPGSGGRGSNGPAASRVVSESAVPKRPLSRNAPETDWKKILMIALGTAAITGIVAFCFFKKKPRPEEEESKDLPPEDPEDDGETAHPAVIKRNLADALRAHADGKLPEGGRALVIHLYQLTLMHLKARGLPRKRSQTPDEYARLSGAMIRSGGAELHRVTNLFSRVLYGRVNPRPEEVEAYVQSVQKLVEKV